VPAIVREAIEAHRYSDVLVFLAGAADIRRVGDQLRRAGALPSDVDVRSLFGALSADEQDLALRPSPAGRRRVVLATDIAETSLTVDGVRVVVDSGEVRTPRYDLRSGLTRLHTGPNSRASAEQRAGRAGRLGAGVAYRLWSPAEHATRTAFAAPEITTVDLAGVALELAVWGAAPDDLRFLDPPPRVAFDAARALLTELGALDGDGRVTDVGRAMVVLPVHPRLARMIVAASNGPAGSTACALAALLEERDVLRGRPDDLPSDINERVRLIRDPEAHHPDADAAAVRLVRRRARELERRASVPRNPVDLSATGPALALAYPDRVAQARGGGRFQLRHGERAWLPTGDALTGESFLVVAALGERAGRDRPEGDLRIHLAAALDVEDVEAIGGASIEDRSTLVWDRQRDDLRRRTERRLGALVLTAKDGPAARGDDTVAALLAHVRVAGLDVLRWTPAASALRARVAFARDTLGGSWPDLSDDALLATLDEWLAPYLIGATRRADLERIDVAARLRDRVGHHRLVDLDRLAPTHLVLATGRTLPVDYAQPVPRVASRVQDFYGTTGPLAVADGRVPVVVELRSPADRPVQVTADLAGFWRGSWSEVRKDLAGRYPKHAWPAEPSVADAQRPARPRRPKN
jgi:ATP-dependent helicase HrpB